MFSFPEDLKNKKNILGSKALDLFKSLPSIGEPAPIPIERADGINGDCDCDCDCKCQCVAQIIKKHDPV